MEDKAHSIVGRHSVLFTDPPDRIPNDASVNAPLLGNGDMGVAFAGPPEAVSLWLAKNDFWRLKSRYGESMPKVFGRIDIAMPSMKGAAYEVGQHLVDATTHASFTSGDVVVEMATWVAATENCLVVEMHVENGQVPVHVRGHVARSTDSEFSEGNDGAVHWMQRGFVDGVDIPVSAACAMALLGADDLEFTLKPGAPVTLVAAMSSSFDSEACREDACRVAADATKPESLSVLREAHEGWWREFWGHSYVDIDDEAIERHYYLSNYIMGSCSRDPEFPPGIFGTWVTTNSAAWFGDYHLNYNHMAPYYGLVSSNHIEQAAPCHGPILAFMERGKYYAREVTDCRGVLYPVGIGPKGIETTRDTKRHEGQVQAGGLFFGQKSNAAYCVVNMSMRWRRTYDPEYAKEVYPFVREVAYFWEDYLRFEDGRYVIHDDAIHEGSGRNFNPILSLGLVRNVFETAIDMGKYLGHDRDRYDKWKHILEHLSEFPTQEKDGKTVFRYTELGTAWWRDNTLGIQHIYPAGAIGLDSDPELLAISRNTIDVMDRWTDFNGMNSLFPAAVRVGYDPETVRGRLHDYVVHHTERNGFALGNPHGIENCSIVPNTVNEMLCSGHQGVLRVFPGWPKDRDAEFHNLRVQGAFLVSAKLEGGEVQHLWIVSERGNPCTMVNPWPGQGVAVIRGDGTTETFEGARFTIQTSTGETVGLDAKAE